MINITLVKVHAYYCNIHACANTFAIKMSGYKSDKVAASGAMSIFPHLIDPENSQPLYSLAYLIFQCMQI